MSAFPDEHQARPIDPGGRHGPSGRPGGRRSSRPAPTGFTSTSWTATSFPISRSGPWSCGGCGPLRPIPLEVHLMISEPDRYLDAFAEAGADTLIVHEEGAIHLNRTVQEIHRLGLQAGVAINPATPASCSRRSCRTSSWCW